LGNSGDEAYADYIKRIRQEAHKVGLPDLLLSLLSRCRSVLSAAQAQSKKKRKSNAKEEEVRTLMATICASLTWCLKDEGAQSTDVQPIDRTISLVPLVHQRSHKTRSGSEGYLSY
jgi:hypothetical protein